MKNTREVKQNEIKKLTIAQGKETAKTIAETMGLNADEVFNKLVAEGRISNGRGCYTPFQEFYNSRYETFKAETLKEAKKQGLEQVNSKGQSIDIALNHKAIK